MVDLKKINHHHAARTCRLTLIIENGGASRDRTDDLLLAKQALSQLSYGPVEGSPGFVLQQVVGLGGFEPPTSPLSGVRSNQLSYRPGFAHSCEDPIRKLSPERTGHRSVFYSR